MPEYVVYSIEDHKSGIRTYFKKEEDFFNESDYCEITISIKENKNDRYTIRCNNIKCIEEIINPKIISF